MPKYDVIIKAHPKDYIKIKYVVSSLAFLNPQPENIFIISPDGFIPEENKTDSRIQAVCDKDVFPNMDRTLIKYRPNWAWTMFLSLFQNITPNEYYLDVNSDNFFVKNIDLFDEQDKPIFFISPDHRHYHVPYFVFNKEVFNLEDRKILTKPYGLRPDDSFIVDFMMFKRSIAREMLDMYGGIDNLFKKCSEVISIKCNMGDTELYPAWCMTYHPNFYTIKDGIRVHVTGKDAPFTFVDEEISSIINEYSTVKDIIAVSCHSWLM